MATGDDWLRNPHWAQKAAIGYRGPNKNHDSEDSHYRRWATSALNEPISIYSNEYGGAQLKRGSSDAHSSRGWLNPNSGATAADEEAVYECQQRTFNLPRCQMERLSQKLHAEALAYQISPKFRVAPSGYQR